MIKGLWIQFHIHTLYRRAPRYPNVPESVITALRGKLRHSWINPEKYEQASCSMLISALQGYYLEHHSMMCDYHPEVRDWLITDFLQSYQDHSLARGNFHGFRDIPTAEWFSMGAGPRLVIRSNRLNAWLDHCRSINR